ncbi:MAG: hypothetical protein HYU52_00575, partial [Acidobacteria bacterium]|nr:hypothetical protein [Acidobacteriota bacterium]
KVALFGRLTAWDAMIPPLFFRFGQYEALTFIPNPSHGVIPVVLALLACRSLLIENGWARLAALTAISFFASHTGFGFFLPPMLIGVLLLRGIYEWRNRARAAMSFLTATAVGVAAATMLVGFRFEELRAVPCRFGSPTVTDHVIWVITMVKASFGFLGRDELAIAGATLVYLIPAASALAVSVTRIARTVPDSDDEREFSLAATPAVLICVSVAFCLSSAWARLCLGPVQALDSRYVTLMIPFAIGLYFSIIRWDVERGMSGATSARKVVRLALLAVLMVSSVHGGFHIAQSDRAGVERSRETKRAWVACARAGGTVAECDFRSQLKVHPVPSATRLDEKLEFLRERRLSFFRPDYE